MTHEFHLEFAKVKYAPGAPKNAPRWVWRCTCEHCRALGDAAIHGPFKTRRAAERDAVNACALVVVEPSGSS